MSFRTAYYSFKSGKNLADLEVTCVILLQKSGRRNQMNTTLNKERTVNE